MKLLWEWNKDSEEMQKLRDEAKGSAYGLIILCIAIAVGLVVTGVVRIVCFFKEL